VWSGTERRQSFEETGPAPIVAARLKTRFTAWLLTADPAIHPQESSVYFPPPPELLGLYLVNLGQSLALLWAQRGVLSAGDLFGDRQMLAGFEALALQMPGAILPPLMLLSGLIRNHAYGSDIYREFESRYTFLLDH